MLMKQKSFSSKREQITSGGADQEIPDPNAVRPADWNEAENGPWTAPMIPNPNHKTESREVAIDHNNDKDFEGWCWPGTSVYPDFTSPDMRQEWANHFALSKFQGSTMDTYTW